MLKLLVYLLCSSHCFKHLYTLSCMNLTTDLIAKLTLNYPHYQMGKLKNKEYSLSLATQTTKLLSQDLILVSGFRGHIYSLCYAGDGNIGMSTLFSIHKCSTFLWDLICCPHRVFRTDFWPVSNPGPECLSPAHPLAFHLGYTDCSLVPPTPTRKWLSVGDIMKGNLEID